MCTDYHVIITSWEGPSRMGLVRIDFITIYALDFITIFASACRITMSGSGSDEEPFDGGDGGEQTHG